MKKTLCLIMALGLSTQIAAAPSEKSVLSHYADLAQAKYEDSLETARALQKSVDGLIAKPTETNLTKARKAWKAARAP